MKTVKKLLPTLGMVCLYSLGLSAAPSSDREKLSSANNTFAFSLLKQLAKDEQDANIFISPYSAATVLQMACNGAGGQTRAQMQQVLRTGGLRPDAVNEIRSSVSLRLNATKNGIILTTANALWYRQGIPVKSDFIARNRDIFGATVGPLDFDDPRSVRIINDWAQEKTHGKIESLADGLINRDTVMFLANAVYFKGKWEQPFDSKHTKDRAFHLPKRQPRKIPMMEQSRRFTYRRGSGYQAVRLNYEGWSLGMYVFLPDENSSPEKLLSLMSGDKWQRITEPGFTEQQGTVVLPKFKIRYSAELKQALAALGMKSAFSDKADFSGISNRPLLISAVQQNTFVEVNEEGTEAAAATGLAISEGIELEPPKPFEMIVDRPFLFLIEDKETETILFMGVVHDPSASL